MVKAQRENGARSVSNKLYYFHAKRGIQSLEPELLPYLRSIVLADVVEDDDGRGF